MPPAPRRLENGGSNPTGISQSLHLGPFQPVKWAGIGVNDNFFRQLPTFDPLLVGTGLLDKYLFRASVETFASIFRSISACFASLGQSKTTTDTKSS